MFQKILQGGSGGGNDFNINWDNPDIKLNNQTLYGGGSPYTTTITTPSKAKIIVCVYVSNNNGAVQIIDTMQEKCFRYIKYSDGKYYLESTDYSKVVKELSDTSIEFKRDDATSGSASSGVSILVYC